MEHAHVPLNIRSQGSVVDDDLRTHVDKRLSRSLAKLGSRVERVTVRFKDVNGPRGGVDQMCRIKVVVKGLPSVVYTARASSLQQAIQRAATGTERAVRRAVRRRVRRKRARRS